MKICENCKSEHNGNYGSGRFCSKKCARGFSTKAKRKEINKKVSKTLKEKESGHGKVKKICPICNKIFFVVWMNRKQKCCSISCGVKINGGWKNVHNKLNKEDWSKINKKAYANGNNYVAGGTTKWYNYKNIKVQGTYELRTCKILDNWKEKRKIKDWEYTNDRIEYRGLDKEKHNYLLDFKIFENNGSFYYIETKGYEKPNDKLKWKAVKNNGNKLEVWFNEDIKEKENKIK
jgi:hypothetical protein